MPPYPVSEDTLLLLDNVECRGRVLDMGTGNGSIALKCARERCEVVAVDLDPEAIEEVMEKARREGLKIKTILSDLFQNVEGKFDTIVFNPPYLPGDPKDVEELQWAGGGKHGDETVIRFLEEAKNYLNEDGRIYIILSSFNRIEKIREMLYRFTLLATKKFSFHEIYLYELRK